MMSALFLLVMLVVELWDYGLCDNDSTTVVVQCVGCAADTPIAQDFGALPAAFILVIETIAADYQPWVLSVVGSCLIGLSGILPLLFIPADAASSLRDGDGAKTLKRLLSFAVGGLLADVFLHLLPEAWRHLHEKNTDPRWGHFSIGLWVLAGIFTFIVVELMFTREEETVEFKEEHRKEKKVVDICSLNNNSLVANDKNNAHQMNGCCGKSEKDAHGALADGKPITGYLNLVANGIDNFAHGLAVAGSFLVSTRVGVLTTAAILLHEVPHEFGDFAILLRSGFDRWAAAKAQIATATIGIIGAIAALSADNVNSIGDNTAWILPFTAGGFINISLVNVLPDLMKEKDPKESMLQFATLMGGVATMGLLTIAFE